MALSIGEGERSRVYVTDNGGRTWAETFRNTDPAAFYDCVAFFDRRHGLALSDPVGGEFRILSTRRRWPVVGGRLPRAAMPAALDGEFAFAASGTCLVTASAGGQRQRVARHRRRFVVARLPHSRLRPHWTATATPVPSGPTAGIYSLAFRDARHGLAVGGDFSTPTAAPDGAATSRRRRRHVDSRQAGAGRVPLGRGLEVGLR